MWHNKKKGMIQSPDAQPGTSILSQALAKRRMNAGKKLSQRAKAISGSTDSTPYNPTKVLPPA